MVNKRLTTILGFAAKLSISMLYYRWILVLLTIAIIVIYKILANIIITLVYGGLIKR